MGVTATLFASGASAADRWREYVYPGLKFAVSFPAPPKIEEVDCANAGGVAIRARAYSLEQDGKIYKVTVADFSRTGLDEIGILDLGVNSMTRNVDIKWICDAATIWSTSAAR